jgi:hypothetical protein
MATDQEKRFLELLDSTQDVYMKAVSGSREYGLDLSDIGILLWVGGDEKVRCGVMPREAFVPEVYPVLALSGLAIDDRSAEHLRSAVWTGGAEPNVVPVPIAICDTEYGRMRTGFVPIGWTTAKGGSA